MFIRLAPRTMHIVLICVSLCLSSCSSLITTNVIQPAVSNLQQQTNIDLVCEGAPAFLLMIDSMLVNSPENQDLLLTGTQSYSGYAAALEECGGADKVAPIADKAKLYGLRLLGSYLPSVTEKNYADLDRELARLDRGDVPDVFWGTYGWLIWLKEQKGSPEAIADIVFIEKIMLRLLEIDESYEGGSIHLFFGSYYAAKPAMLGGRPDLSKIHFDKALTLSRRSFLLTQTTYAETLARATQDQQLHDRLLKEVLAFPLDSAPEFGLSNRIAVSKAKRLLKENYFGD
ncbi:MAG: TRAP transporter TatT component family protein [Desulfocapsaceae bacterium]